jgi:uncharacterized protein (DUF924 family)
MDEARSVREFWFGRLPLSAEALNRRLPFWFGGPPSELGRLRDEHIRERFGELFELAASGALASWADGPRRRLSLILLLDQFPRNMFRGSARAFATDPLARAVAERAIAHGFDASVASAERAFFYLPFMHSENPADQERSLALWRQAGDGKNRKYAELHASIIRRFGRFPHRNAVLGRTTTPEEQAFLDAGGFAG